MKKLWIFWSLAALLVVGLITWSLDFSFVATRDMSRMELQELTDEAGAAELLKSTLAQDLRENPVWFVGLFTDDKFGYDVFSQFVRTLPPEIQFNEIWFDEAWQGDLESFNDLAMDKKVELRGAYLRKNEKLVQEELTRQIAQGRRVLIVGVPIEMNTSMSGTPVHTILEGTKLNAKTIEFGILPRLRTEEAQMKVPCVTSPSDTTGTGSWGCGILNRSRRLYPKRFTPGQPVGLIEYMSDRDVLFLHATESALPSATGN